MPKKCSILLTIQLVSFPRKVNLNWFDSHLVKEKCSKLLVTFGIDYLVTGDEPKKDVQPPVEGLELKRRVGLVSGVALIVGNMIGNFTI